MMQLQDVRGVGLGKRIWTRGQYSPHPAGQSYTAKEVLGDNQIPYIVSVPDLDKLQTEKTTWLSSYATLA